MVSKCAKLIDLSVFMSIWSRNAITRQHPPISAHRAISFVSS